MKNLLRRHGDVNFIPTELPKDAKEVFEGAEFVVAFGEQTGHNHTLTAEPTTKYRIFEHDGKRYFHLNKPAQLSHPEHKTITLEPGTYVQGQEREKDWFSLSVRKVID